jgi:hypothetical protein
MRCCFHLSSRIFSYSEYMGMPDHVLFERLVLELVLVFYYFERDSLLQMWNGGLRMMRNTSGIRPL